MRIELLLFLSLLAMIVVIVACSLPRRQLLVLTPTFFPAVTLTTYDPPVVARVGQEPALAATILPAQARFRALEISPPRCIQTLAPRLTCLGQVRNLGQISLAHVQLRAIFLGAGGEPQGETVFSPAQRRIAAGAAAPYRVDVPVARLEAAVLQLEVANAEAASAGAAPSLLLRDASGVVDARDGSYRLEGIIANEGDLPARAIRAIVTLEDNDGRLVGYRAVELPGTLPGGESAPFELTLTPLIASPRLRHRISLQAERAGP